MKDILVVLAWLLVTGLVNAFMARRSPEQWVQFAEANPRAAAIVKMMRAVGLDPVTLIKSAAALVRGSSSIQQATEGAKILLKKEEDK